MILNIIIRAKIINIGYEKISKVLDDHLFQYFESANKRAIENEKSKEIVAIVPPIGNISKAIWL